MNEEMGAFIPALEKYFVTNRWINLWLWAFLFWIDLDASLRFHPPSNTILKSTLKPINRTLVDIIDINSRYIGRC